jgi:hypothetical protein
MPVTDPAIPDKKHELKNPASHIQVVSLNEVFKDALNQVQGQMSNVNLVIRCESLPSIEGNPEDLQLLFRTLVNVIFDSARNANTKLFLHIDCAVEHTDLSDSTGEENLKKYLIKFHTNITSNQHWEKANERDLGRCREILSKHNGIFVVNGVGGNGCLFTMTVPGKSQ